MRLAPLGVPSSGQASHAAYAGLVVSHGIQLVVSLPHASYPWNALAAVTVRATNVSRHVVGIAPTEVPYSCWIDAPVIVVQRKDVSTAFPPAIPGEPGPNCAPTFITNAQELPPGKSIAMRQRVILRAAHVRAYLNLAIGGRSVEIITLACLCISFPAHPPRRRCTSARRFCHGAASPGAHGAVLIAEWWHCRGRPLVGAPGYMTIEGFDGPFRAVNPGRIRPKLAAGCNRLLEWHAAIGWLNHPVAHIDYVRP
jgi:hypothetical protein